MTVASQNENIGHAEHEDEKANAYDPFSYIGKR